MQQRNPIFIKAWELITEEKYSYKKLFWFGFIPAILTTILSTITFSFQGYRYWTEFVVRGDVRQTILSLLGSIFSYFGKNPGIALLIIFFSAVFFFLYYFLPIVCNGGLIKILPMVLGEEPIKFRMGLIYGGRYFFKLFEFKALFSPFRITWVFLSYSLFKIFAPEMLPPLALGLVLWLIINIIVNLLFLFVEYFIVLEDMGVFESIRESMKMVFMHIEDVLLMFGLILLMEARMIISALLVVLIPLGFFFLVNFFTSTLLIQVGSAFTVLLALGLLLFISYLNTYITLFVTASWTLTYLSFKDKLHLESDPA